MDENLARVMQPARVVVAVALVGDGEVLEFEVREQRFGCLADASACAASWDGDSWQVTTPADASAVLAEVEIMTNRLRDRRPEPEPELAVGDEVEILRASGGIPNGEQYIGQRGIIESFDTAGIPSVRTPDGQKWWYLKNQLRRT